jgi:hypothetical protein
VSGKELPPGFDAGGLRATSAILLGKRRHAVRRAVPRIPQLVGAEFVARFDEFARVKPLSKNQTPLGDAIAFLGWLRRKRALPSGLRFLELKLRWQRVMRR